LAARIGAFEAWVRHAKITPAALHRGDFENRRVEDVEALGRGPEFQSCDFSRIIAGVALRVANLSWMAGS
jgi:hypothetical protein